MKTDPDLLGVEVGPRDALLGRRGAPCYPGLSNKEKFSVLLFFLLNKGFVSSCPGRIFFISVKMGTVDLSTLPSICVFCKVRATSFLLDKPSGWLSAPIPLPPCPYLELCPLAIHRHPQRWALEPKTGLVHPPTNCWLFPPALSRSARSNGLGQPCPLPIGRLSRRHRLGTSPPARGRRAHAGRPRPWRQPTTAAAAPEGRDSALSGAARGRGHACAEARGRERTCTGRGGWGKGGREGRALEGGGRGGPKGRMSRGWGPGLEAGRDLGRPRMGAGGQFTDVAWNGDGLPGGGNPS